MGKTYYILFITCLLFSQASYAQGGLRFNGSEQPIDKRTSYDVFHNKSITFSGGFRIEFDLALYPESKIGYIIRIKNEKSDTIYNLFYDEQGEKVIFKLNEEGKSSLITTEIGRDELPDTQWMKMTISFDLKGDSVKLDVHGKTFGAGNIDLPDKYYPEILFGKSDHIIDVPSFAIKNLYIGNGAENFFFALRENAGNAVHDRKGKTIGASENPVWLINNAYHWSYIASFKSETAAGANYNPDRKEFYYFNRNAIFIYNVKTGNTTTRIFPERCPVKLALGTNFVDTRNNKLYAYETCVDTPGGATVATIDLDTYQWTAESTAQLPSKLHHHGSYFDPDAGRYTIFGGFGNMHYSKDFYSFDINTKTWSVLDGFGGDAICPRYFSSVGYLKKNNSVYIFGGMGNESGEQIVGRRYLYDLHKVDLSTNHVSKLWEIPWKSNNVVPVRGMVILDDSCFYTLCYPEHFSDSFLRLYRFSLVDGSYEILGDSIPIHSDKITTNANIYYDGQMNNLYAVVQEFSDDIASDLKIYSLAFPSITATELVSYPHGKRGMRLALILLTCGCAVAAWILFLKQRRGGGNRKDTRSPDTDNGSGKSSKPNAIYLFGDFEVRDRYNKDITHMFSTRLKQTFCLILQNDANGGISSQHLSDLLWGGKPEDKVKNSRGVTINHLRKVLSELDGVELIYDKGCFKIVQSQAFYCDYSRCLQIISSKQTEENTAELVEIIKRGKFLKLSDHSIFDTFKQEVEHKLEPVLSLEMEKCYTAKDYPMSIAFAEALFNIDPLNEEALNLMVKSLQKLKKTEEARIKYQAFAMEYYKTMGVEYPHPFKS